MVFMELCLRVIVRACRFLKIRKIEKNTVFFHSAFKIVTQAHEKVSIITFLAFHVQWLEIKVCRGF